jgi:hypothetical protein
MTGEAAATTGASASLSAGLQVSSASCLEDLEGPFATLGGSVGEGTTVDVEGFAGPGTRDQPVLGGYLGVGMGAQATGPIPGELHGGVSSTRTVVSLGSCDSTGISGK